MKFDILTLFPAMFDGPLTESIIKKAADRGILEINIHNIRDHAHDRHSTADDSPYGGGAGMVMKIEPLGACIEQVKTGSPNAKVIMTSPKGRVFTHAVARELASEEALVIICGRYEGVDERVRELFVDDEISIGDFVLTGGELPAMVIVDAVARLIPGVLGSEDSALGDSFADGLLEYPHYTRPPEYRGVRVPDVLLSGNHKDIALWRRRQSLLRTFNSRPDLLDDAELSKKDREYLQGLEEHASGE
jgi:tRNA (guanine37-N1)-methyltransferase